MTQVQEGYLEFSIDFDGKCEEVENFSINNGEDLSEKVDYDKVDEFITELLKVPGFLLSEHRTEVRIWWEGDKMEIQIRNYTEPDWGVFDEHSLKDVGFIKPNLI